jgi:hypothetical protein
MSNSFTPSRRAQKNAKCSTKRPPTWLPVFGKLNELCFVVWNQVQPAIVSSVSTIGERFSGNIGMNSYKRSRHPRPAGYDAKCERNSACLWSRGLMRCFSDSSEGREKVVFKGDKSGTGSSPADQCVISRRKLSRSFFTREQSSM